MAIARTNAGLPARRHDRMLELSPLFWERTRARLDAKQLAAECGAISIPPEPLDTSAAVQQQVAAS